MYTNFSNGRNHSTTENPNLTNLEPLNINELLEQACTNETLANKILTEPDLVQKIQQEISSNEHSKKNLFKLALSQKEICKKILTDTSFHPSLDGKILDQILTTHQDEFIASVIGSNDNLYQALSAYLKTIKNYSTSPRMPAGKLDYWVGRIYIEWRQDSYPYGNRNKPFATHCFIQAAKQGYKSAFHSLIVDGLLTLAIFKELLDSSEIKKQLTVADYISCITCITFKTDYSIRDYIFENCKDIFNQFTKGHLKEIYKHLTVLQFSALLKNYCDNLADKKALSRAHVCFEYFEKKFKGNFIDIDSDATAIRTNLISCIKNGFKPAFIFLFNNAYSLSVGNKILSELMRSEKIILQKLTPKECITCAESDLFASALLEHQEIIAKFSPEQFNQFIQLLLLVNLKNLANALLADTGDSIPDYNRAYACLRVINHREGREEREAKYIFLLAECYFYGRGTEKSIQLAIEYYQLAAKLGYLDAQWMLANCYNEQGAPREAFNNYNSAAKKGHRESMYKVGCCYLQGKGVWLSDEDKAIEWFEKAAAKNHPGAQYELGKIHLKKGKYHLAWKNFYSSWKQGYLNAYKNVAEFCVRGHGELEVNFEDAYKLYQKCKENVEFTANDWIHYGVSLLCYSTMFPTQLTGIEAQDLEQLKHYKDKIFEIIIGMPQTQLANQILLAALDESDNTNPAKQLALKPRNNSRILTEGKDYFKKINSAAKKRGFLELSNSVSYQSTTSSLSEAFDSYKECSLEDLAEQIAKAEPETHLQLLHYFCDDLEDGDNQRRAEICLSQYLNRYHAFRRERASRYQASLVILAKAGFKRAFDEFVHYFKINEEILLQEDIILELIYAEKLQGKLLRDDYVTCARISENIASSLIKTKGLAWVDGFSPKLFRDFINCLPAKELFSLCKYYYNLGKTKDPDYYDRAFQCLKLAVAEQKAIGRSGYEAEGNFLLGQCFYHGYGTEKNIETAIVYYERAAELGHLEARYILGYITGDAQHYKLAAEQGHAESMYQWGLSLLKNNSAPLASNWFAAPLLEKKHPGMEYAHWFGFQNKTFRAFESSLTTEQLFTLARYYYELGETVAPVYYEQAIKYFKLAANHRNTLKPTDKAECYFLLAQCFYHGYGIEKNRENAIGYYAQAAELGHLEACYMLGYTTNNEKHYELAAKQGHVESMYRLACFYYFSENVSQTDKDQAIPWLENAAKQHHASSLYMLGIIYLEEANYDLAFDHFTRACEKGKLEAHINIAEFYLNAYDNSEQINYQLAYEEYQQCKGKVGFTKKDWINYGVSLLCYSLDPSSNLTYVHAEDLKQLKNYKAEIFEAIANIPNTDMLHQIVSAKISDRMTPAKQLMQESQLQYRANSERRPEDITSSLAETVAETVEVASESFQKLDNDNHDNSDKDLQEKEVRRTEEPTQSLSQANDAQYSLANAFYEKKQYSDAFNPDISSRI